MTQAEPAYKAATTPGPRSFKHLAMSSPACVDSVAGGFTVSWRVWGSDWSEPAELGFHLDVCIELVD